MGGSGSAVSAKTAGPGHRVGAGTYLGFLPHTTPMGSLGPFEIIAILLVVLLLFGAKRIPEIARGLGKGIREFKDATNEIKQELNVDPPRQQAPRQIHQSPQSSAPPAQAQPSQPVATEAAAPPPPAPESPADPQSQA